MKKIEFVSLYTVYTESIIKNKEIQREDNNKA